MSAAADFAARLKAKKTSRGWTARCPAHNDRTPSLDIIEGENGKLVMTCRSAGCTFEQILAAAGVEREKPNGHANGHAHHHEAPKKKIVATYNYHDATGKFVYQVVRFAPKDFRQRAPNGAWSVQGIDKVPYRLPELLNASEIYIVEGEKDVDNLAKIGIVATCNPGGADNDGAGGKKWLAEWGAAYFAGRHVILIPDNDDVGRRHVVAVAAKLNGHAASIRILELPGLPDKGDVSDWLNAGGTIEALQALAADLPEPKPAASSGRVIHLADYGAERFTGQPPPIKWLVENSIPLGVLVLLASQGGVGKSYKLLELCYQVAIPQKGNLALNYPVLGGHVVEHGRAAFITSEDDEDEMHRRLAALDFLGLRHGHPGQLIPVALPNAGGPLPLFIATHNGVQTTPEWDMLCDQLAGVPDLKLVGLDPLGTFAQAELDKDNSAAAFITGKLAALSAELKATVLVAHHMRKGSQAPKSLAEARENIRGASNLVDGVRTAYALWLPDDSEARRVCKDMRIPFEYGRVAKGAIVKTNRKANQSISTYIRTDDGLLLDRSSDLEAIRPQTRAGLEDALVEAVATQAEAKQPLTHTGENGLFKQSHRLPECLRGIPRAKLEAMAQELLDSERLVKCIVPGSKTAKVLDVPGGAYDIGDTEFAIGGVRAERKRPPSLKVAT